MFVNLTLLQKQTDALLYITTHRLLRWAQLCLLIWFPLTYQKGRADRISSSRIPLTSDRFEKKHYIVFIQFIVANKGDIVAPLIQIAYFK